MNWLLTGLRVATARRELAALADRMRVAYPSRWAPGLLAAVDQHAAAVRDILLFGGHGVGPVALACYARGVEDVARERGWRPPPSASWLHSAVVQHDWVSLRLAAVCVMAGAAAVGVTPGDADPLAFP